MNLLWEVPSSDLDGSLAGGWAELPEVIPDWMLEQAPLAVPLGCDCTGHDAMEDAAASGAGWAVPGVTGLPGAAGAGVPGLPPVSDLVVQVQALLERLAAVTPSEVPALQALADGQALLGLEQQLRLLNLHRLADVGARGLHELVGFRSATAWVREHRPDGDSGDATLARQLRSCPVLDDAVHAGRVPLGGARKVLLALRKVTPHLDRADGLIDGQPGDQVLTAVVGHVVTLVCRNLQGLTDDDPRLAALIRRGRQVLAAGTQAQIVEAAFSWLAEELPARHLTRPLDELVVALLPSVLEDRAEKGRLRAGLTLTPLPDGRGWHLCGDLSLECGEQLWTALRAEAARDPRNATDTATWAEASDTDKQAWRDNTPTPNAKSTSDSRGTEPSNAVGANSSTDPTDPSRPYAGTDPFDAGSDPERPRARRERLHDALERLLTRYLEHGLGGTAGKVPVQVHVTLTEPTITGQPGAPPARADSGQLIPRRLVKRWWCDSSVTGYVLSLGGKALRVIHAQRTLTGDERRALLIEGGDRCVGDGCCSGEPDPLTPLQPHHVHGYAGNQLTSLGETLPACKVLHHDLHDGHKTVRLRDGRYLNEFGFVDGPDLGGTPPF